MEGKALFWSVGRLLGDLLTRGVKAQNLRLRNKALLAKWLWWFSSELESLWHRIILPILFERLSKGVKGTFWNSWKHISLELPSLLEDQWVGVRPLCSAFPHSYHLSSYKSRPVSSMLVWSRSSMSFSFGFHCSLSDREARKVASLLSLLDEVKFRLGRRDVCIGSPNPLEGFS